MKQRILTIVMITVMFFSFLLNSCADSSVTADSTGTSNNTSQTQEPQPEIPPAETGYDHMVDQRFYQNDDKFDILLIGNSYSYYWTDELWQMLNAAGYKNVRICNIYKSGATLEQHLTWHESNSAECSFFIVDTDISNPNDRTVVKSVTLDYCLAQGNWDVISLQQSNKWAGSEEKHRNNTDPYLPKLDQLLKSKFPDAEYYWQANWAHEIGKDSYSAQSTLTKVVNVFRNVGLDYCAQYGYTLVPLGDAWELIRHDPLFYQSGPLGKDDYPVISLHTRIYHAGSSKGKVVNSDLSHDGDVGGGQYLNACVWFEILTKQSCIGNPFIPSYYCQDEDKTYTLTDDQLSALQNAANMTVTEKKN